MWTHSYVSLAGDFRRNFDRFSDENFAHNAQLAEKLGAIAEKKGVTPARTP
jgi:aryl-alcohol dehydrogenase-like predicted oxidoreductase